jgi:hypothetical protein
VNLVDEQDPRYDCGFTFLPPFRDFPVDLIADLGLYLTGIAGEEGEETLLAGVDYVNLVEGYYVDYLLALLELALGTLDEPAGVFWAANGTDGKGGLLKVVLV